MGEKVCLMEKLKKTPLQQRSRHLFDSIVESATRILPTLGYSGATTNKIAERAGVSIGSLYQYFPHKDAIFANVFERELKKQSDEISTFIRTGKDKTLEEIIKFLSERFVTIYLGQKGLSRELFLNASKMGQVGEVLYMRNQVIDLLTGLLVEKRGLDSVAARRKIFIALNAFMGVIQTCCILNEPPMSDETVKNECVFLLNSYLA